MGLSLGLIGGGGSILTVPILVYLFHIEPVQATGYSLFIVGLTALFGGIDYARKGLIDFRTGFTFALPSFLGVYLARAYLVPAIPDEIASIAQLHLTKNLLIMVVFALLMIVASVSMIRQGNGVCTRRAVLKPGTRVALIGIEGLVIGGITGLVGAGGGFLIIPALVVLTGLSMSMAVGTSLMIIAIKSLFGFAGDLHHGAQVSWPFLLTIAAIAVTGIFVGSALAKFVPEAKLKKTFGVFVLTMGTLILIQQLSHTQ